MTTAVAQTFWSKVAGGDVTTYCRTCKREQGRKARAHSP